MSCESLTVLLYSRTKDQCHGFHINNTGKTCWIEPLRRFRKQLQRCFKFLQNIYLLQWQNIVLNCCCFCSICQTRKWIWMTVLILHVHYMRHEFLFSTLLGKGNSCCNLNFSPWRSKEKYDSLLIWSSKNCQLWSLLNIVSEMDTASLFMAELICVYSTCDSLPNFQVYKLYSLHGCVLHKGAVY